MTKERKWYAAYTKMHQERSAAGRLRAQGIEVFVPLRKEVRQWSDRKKVVEVPIVSMLIFVYVTEEERIQVLQDRSVSRYLILRGESRPAAIPEDQMEAFKFMLYRADRLVEFEPRQLKKGQRVRVIRGPMKGLVAEFLHLKGRDVLVTTVDLLGSAYVGIHAEDVELLE